MPAINQVQIDDTVYDILPEFQRKANAVPALQSDLTETDAALNLATGVEKINLADKQYVNLTGTTVTMSDGQPAMQSTNNFNCAVLPCTEGDVFTISGTGGSSARLWGFVDESGSIISKADSNVEESEKELSAPVGAAWLILNNSISSNAVSYVGGNLSERINKIVDITNSLNDEGYINLGYKHGNVNYSSGVDEWNNLARTFSHVYVPVDEIVRIVANNNAQYSLRYYDGNKQYISGMSSWATSETFSVPNGCKYIRICGRYSSNAEIINLLQFAEDLKVYCKSFRLNDIEKRFPFASNNKIFSKSTGNASIVCAKELTNDDGNCPVIEWYLLEEAGGTNRFYVSRDLHEKQFAFMFTGDAYMYSFGVLANGDIIAVLDASSINWDDAGSVERSESFRKNPYVFLASENWSVQHEVAFTADLKPLGWLSNYGFRVLPDGSAVFAEYTRYCVLTSNVWRVNGDPTDAANWTAVISLTLPEPGLNLLKHWHTVQYDPYGKVAYAATGDSNSGSFCYCSTDYGVTWTQLSVNGVDHSDKYFRFLNLIFTEDTVYWAKDWYDAGHYLFKCGRNANGILDIDNVVDWIQIPTVENLSTYTTCYIPEIDAILLLEREDSGGGTNAPAPIRLCDLTDGTLHTVAYMKSAKGVREQIGFRTRYSEVYPVHGIINVGWALRRQVNAEAVNLLSWYDNAGNDAAPYKYGLDNVNNLWLEVYKNSSGFKLRVGTRLV